MKKFLIKIAIFFAIVAIVDVSFGMAFHYLQAHAGGRTGAEYYVCEKATEDVIIMGSSRASHHYVPEIISEKLGMSCFNAGQDGNGIILQYGRWKMLKQHNIPKLIIYDISPSFDFGISDNMTYVDRLKPFSKKNAINEYISTLFPMERVKMQSQLYCYNYKFIEMLSDCLRSSNYRELSGYIPLNGHIRKEIVERKNMKRGSKIEIDEIKCYYLEQLIKEAQEVGTKTVLVMSPSWKGGNYTSKAFSVIKVISDKYSIPLYDYIDSEICDNPDYFEDSSHLNDLGAKFFSSDLATRIKNEVQ